VKNRFPTLAVGMCAVCVSTSLAAADSQAMEPQRSTMQMPEPVGAQEERSAINGSPFVIEDEKLVTVFWVWNKLWFKWSSPAWDRHLDLKSWGWATDSNDPADRSADASGRIAVDSIEVSIRPVGCYGPETVSEDNKPVSAMEWRISGLGTCIPREICSTTCVTHRGQRACHNQCRDTGI
jgi:hypothetical protein